MPASGEAVDDSSEVVLEWVGAPRAGFAPGAPWGLWVKGKAGRESWVSVTSRVLGSLTWWSLDSCLNSAIRETRDWLRGAKGGSEEFRAVTFHCTQTDNVVGDPGNVRVGEARKEEASLCPWHWGTRRTGLLENPWGVGPGRGPGGARKLRRGWVTYVCSGGQN